MEKIKKDEVNTYIANLARTPDVIKLNIDPGHGGINKIK